jgi:hypothetical protein
MLLLLLACKHETPGVKPAGVDDPHVLILVLDGVRTEEFSTSWKSDLTGLSGEAFAEGAWGALEDALIVREAFNVGLTSTAPGHATLVTGRHEPVMTVPYVNQNPGVYRPELPTIFEEARTQNGWPQEEALLLADSVVMPSSTYSLAPGFGEGAVWSMLVNPLTGEAEQDDREVLKEIKQIINAGPPHVWMVNLHDADRQGHAGSKENYLERISRQSDIVEELWTWIQEEHPDYAWQLQLVITSDHGRHRHDMDGGWFNHGDSCSGCRGVPLFIAGGGIATGEVEGSYTLLDVAPTVAGHLGIELPYAAGLPLGGKGQPRSGDVSLMQLGEVAAWSRYQDDLEQRSVVMASIAGEETVLSSPEAFAAEAPALISGEAGNVVCFRELIVDSEADSTPWLPRCLKESNGTWEDIGFPDSYTGPFFHPHLQMVGNTLWASWLYTPLTRGEVGGLDSVKTGYWTENTGWVVGFSETVEFTTTDITSAFLDASHFIVAAATSLPDPDQAYSRRIELWDQSQRLLTSFTLTDLLPAPRRAERPALTVEEGRVRLAMLGIAEETRGIVWTESQDGGQSWSEPELTVSDIFAHLSPQWSEGELIWAALENGEAALCRASDPAETPVCTPTGSPRIDSFSVAAHQAMVVIDTGAGQWEPVELVLK